MKIAIISDIHSNLEALTACCKIAEGAGAEKFICLGDCVGYGPDPIAVLDMLQNLPNFICILGNHDEYTFNCIDVTSTVPVQMVAEWTSKQLSESHLNFFKSLPYIHIENGVTYVHASIPDPGSWAYVKTTDQVRKCLAAASTNLIFSGHVHIPMMFHEKQDDSIEFIHPQASKTYHLHQNQRYFINAGSVGQPRDDNNAASFVLYDEGSHSVTFHRVVYNYQETIRKIHQNNLHPYFAERLESGR